MACLVSDLLVYFFIPAARTALITMLPTISETGAPREQSQTTFLNPCSIGP